MYLDGTKKDITLIEDTINPAITSTANLYFILSIPKEIAEKSSELKIMNLEYNVIKDDPVISFNSDSKEIIYYLNKEVSLDSLEDIIISPIKAVSNEITDSSITGNSILGTASNGSWGIIALAIFAFILGIYFLRIKSETSIKPVLKIMEDIKKVKRAYKEWKRRGRKGTIQISKRRV